MGGPVLRGEGGGGVGGGGRGWGGWGGWTGVDGGGGQGEATGVQEKQDDSIHREVV